MQSHQRESGNFDKSIPNDNSEEEEDCSCQKHNRDVHKFEQNALKHNYGLVHPVKCSNDVLAVVNLPLIQVFFYSPSCTSNIREFSDLKMMPR